MSKVTNSRATAKDALGSPSKQPRKKKEPPRVQPESEWRSSWLTEHVTITKTNALKNYHLLPRDLEGVPHEKIPATEGLNKYPMFLYNERTVEIIAWKKYGGPEGFENMLISKKEKWLQKSTTKAGSFFPQPSTYMNISSPIRSSLRAPAVRPRTKIQPNFETLSANLLEMKTKMEKEDKLWLWNTLIERYLEWYNRFPDLIPDQELEEIMLSAADLEYPPRPTSPLPETSSCDTLKRVLARAPADDGLAIADGLVGDITPWNGRCLDWDESYFDEVYDALIKVIEEHGTEGWKRARWAVYEKYVECKLGKLWPHKTFNDYTADDYFWDDSASFWLNSKDRRSSLKGSIGTRKRLYSLLSTVNTNA